MKLKYLLPLSVSFALGLAGCTVLSPSSDSVKESQSEKSNEVSQSESDSKQYNESSKDNVSSDVVESNSSEISSQENQSTEDSSLESSTEEQSTESSIETKLSFSADEVSQMQETFGFELPFCDDATDYQFYLQNGTLYVYYSTDPNVSAFEDYLNYFNDYQYNGEFEDGNDTYYEYVYNETVIIDSCFTVEDNVGWITVIVSNKLLPEDIQDYLDEMYGIEIPLYDVSYDYYFEDDEIFTNYYVYGITQNEFNSYYEEMKASFIYVYDTEEDGVTYHTFITEDQSTKIEVAYYDVNEGETGADPLYVLDVYISVNDDSEDDEISSITLTSMALTLGVYPKTEPETAEVDGYTFAWTYVGDYGHGMQFKANQGTLYNTTPIEDITGITVTLTNGSENSTFSPAFLVEGSMNSDFSDAEELYINFSKQESYTASFIGCYTYMRITSVASGAIYCDSIQFLCSGSSEKPKGESPELSNKEAGLPESETGIYDIDLTKSTYKDITDLLNQYGYGYLTKGTHNVLVIPVQFSDVPASSINTSIEDIRNVLLPKSETGFENDNLSLADFINLSSYGKLDLNVTVIDEWFMPQYDSEYYSTATFKYYEEDMQSGEQIILNEALAYLDSKGYDLSSFDADKNGEIDSVIMINTLDDLSGNYDDDDNFHWAFQYFNYYYEKDDDPYTYDGVNANLYVWMSHEFFHEDEYGTLHDEANYTYTICHEFSHVLGADDYYDTAYIKHPLDGYDIMDSTMSDHSPYTKMIYGWLDNLKLITTDSSVSISLESFEKTGDCVLFGNHFDETMGIFQEYYIAVYYSNEVVNSYSSLFDKPGVVIYHINASLVYDDEYEEYSICNNNTNYKDEYGSINDLITLVNNNEELLYLAGDSLDYAENDWGEDLIYRVTVDSIEDGKATLTFTRKSQ